MDLREIDPEPRGFSPRDFWIEENVFLFKLARRFDSRRFAQAKACGSGRGVRRRVRDGLS